MSSPNWGLVFQQCMQSVEEAWRDVMTLLNELEAPKSLENVGGYLTLYAQASPKDSFLIGHALVHDISSDKRIARSKRSIEKATRLLANRQHLTSFESRNPGQDMWGGAIRLSKPGGVLSFSGLPEEADELFVYLVGRRAGLLSGPLGRQIRARRIGNRYFERAFRE